MKEKALFKVSSPRRKIINQLIIIINSKLERLKLEYNKIRVIKLPENEKKEKIEYYKREIETLKLYHDILEVFCTHANEYNRNRFMKEERGWKTEWDIPEYVFNKSIDGLVEFLKLEQLTSHPKEKKFYKDTLTLLSLLKEFRNKKEP